MDKLKKWLDKQRVDHSFKNAGAGSKLEDTEKVKPVVKSQNESTSVVSKPRPRTAQDEEARLARMKILEAKSSKAPKTYASEEEKKRAEYKAFIKQEAQKQLERERKQSEEQNQNTTHSPTEKISEKQSHSPTEKISPPVMENTQALFTCSLLPDSQEPLPWKEVKAKIEEFLKKETACAEDPSARVVAAAVLIKTINPVDEHIEAGIGVIVKYLENILANPNEPKFLKIRLGNKVFQEKVSSLVGGYEFLEACGFERQQLPSTADPTVEETYLVMSDSIFDDTTPLTEAVEILQVAERIKPTLNRNLSVLHFTPKNKAFGTLPDEYYTLTKEELIREQQERAETVDKLGVLRTKAMRERQERRHLTRYRFALIRVKFPNEIIIQGVFWSDETVSQIFAFVREHLEHSWIPFTLIAPGNGKLLDESGDNDATLAGCNLAPASILSFIPDQALVAEAKREEIPLMFLKKSTLALLKSA